MLINFTERKIFKSGAELVGLQWARIVPGGGTYGKEIITKLDSGGNVRWDVEWDEVALACREQLIALRLTNIDLQHMRGGGGEKGNG